MSELKSSNIDMYSVSMLCIMVQELTQAPRSAVLAGERSLREIMKISNSWFREWRKDTKNSWKGFIGLEDLRKIGDLEPVNIHERVHRFCAWKIQM